MTDPALMQVEAAGQAVVAALDWQSSPEARQAATAYLESLKAGDVRLLATVAFALGRNERPSEVRHFGLKMLQHLIRMRWEEISTEEQRHIAVMSADMLQESAKPGEQWVLKSQAAALMAEVARREGPPFWKDMLPALFSLSSTSPIHAELVAMVLRWLPEDVTVHNEDLEGERRRQLLHGLTQTLPETLPFLYKLLDEHFRAAIAMVQQNQLRSATEHAAAVTATLNAVIAYAEWAPVTSMSSYHLIEACGFLLSAGEFRVSACEVLKLISSRRRPVDETSPQFDAAMQNVFEILCTASEAYFSSQRMASLNKAATNTGDADEGELEFGECLCEAMVALGSHNLHCVAHNDLKTRVYLRQMLGFLQHPKLNSLALPLWTTLLRESTVAMAATASPDQVVTGNGAAAEREKEKEKKGYSLVVPVEVCTILLDTAFQLLQKKSAGDGSFEDESSAQEFSSASDFSQFRSRLVELVRHIAMQRPVLAASNVAQHLESAFSVSLFHKCSSQDFSTLETTQMMLENILNGIPEAFMAAATAPSVLQSELGSIIQGMLQRLLSVEWKEPALVELHTRHFDAMGPYLRHSPAAIPLVVQKLFTLLSVLSVPQGHGESKKDFLRSRLQVCTSFLRLARAADSALLPHMEAIAQTMITLQQQGLLNRSESSLLGESLLVVGSAAGGEQQVQVLEWLLGPLRQQWVQPEWQEHFLSSPSGLAQLLSQEPAVSVLGQNDLNTHGKYNDEMWSVFHTITFFERAMRRCTASGKSFTQPVSVDSSVVDMDALATSAVSHAMVPHLAWILPPLFKLLRCMHALWSQSVAVTLPPQVQGALAMGDMEQASLLGETTSRSAAGASSVSDGQRVDSNGVSSVEGSSVKEIRSWLKGVRDAGYNIVGIAAVRIGGGFFDDADGRAAALATALLENIESMQLHHIRHLLHFVVIPVVRACPPECWDPWLGHLLPPVLIHCHRVLSTAWTSLLQEGTVKAPGKWAAGPMLGMGEGSSTQEMKTEVMKEKVLRDLTRETCLLLSIAASPALNTCPQLEQQSQGERSAMEVGLQFSASDSLIGYIMQHGDAAAAALHVGIDALEWPDSESVHKAILFCGAVVNMASVASNSQLQDVVGKDMFSAAIRGLTLESNAAAQAELVGLLREIYLRLSARTSGPRQVLLSLPSMTPDTLAAFETALSKTLSTKEQRQHMKSFLLAAGGDQLKALKPQRNTNVITNVSNRTLLGQHADRGGHRDRVNQEEHGSIGLAAIL